MQVPRKRRPKPDRGVRTSDQDELCVITYEFELLLLTIVCTH